MQNTYIQFEKFGRPSEVLQVREENISPLKEGEVLVRMVARPINPSDLIPIRGSYAHRIPLPNIPGYEGVGIVELVGSEGNQHLIGKRVLPLRGEGTWQQFVKADAKYIIEVPGWMDDMTAAQMYINPVTAWVICRETLELDKGDILVVNACNSAIGRIFAQLSNILGFTLIAVIRNDRYKDELLQLGAEAVINTSLQPLQETIFRLTNGLGANAAIDSIGGKDGTSLAFSVRSGGKFLTLGLLSGVQVDWKRIHEEANIHPTLFHLRHWNKKVTLEEWRETFHQLFTYVHSKELALIGQEVGYPLVDVREAVHYVETRDKNIGKVMLLDK